MFAVVGPCCFPPVEGLRRNIVACSENKGYSAGCVLVSQAASLPAALDSIQHPIIAVVNKALSSKPGWRVSKHRFRDATAKNTEHSTKSSSRASPPPPASARPFCLAKNANVRFVHPFLVAPMRLLQRTSLQNGSRGASFRQSFRIGPRVQEGRDQSPSFRGSRQQVQDDGGCPGQRRRPCCRGSCPRRKRGGG